MLKLNKKPQYALIALLHMDALPPGAKATAREIADCYHIPGDVLGKVLQALGRAGLIESLQGVHGGYRLTRPLAGVTLGAVVEAVEGPIKVTLCDGNVRQCPAVHCRQVRRAVFDFQQKLLRLLCDVPLTELRGMAGDPAEPEATDG